MRILFTRPDGGLSVVHGFPKSDIEIILGELTDDAYKAHIWDCSIPKDAINALEIDDDYQLPDREFRDAWMQSGKEVAHDLEKARVIQLDKIRVARKAKLDALDVQFMQALEYKDIGAQNIIATEKQKLRDITGQLKAMELVSIEDVKGAFPNELKD